jgi:phage gp36-like protein
MAYAVQSDLVPLRMTQKDLNELTIDNVPGQTPIDPTSTEGLAIVAAVTSAALEEASGRVDSYCRARYVTPLQQSDDVKSLTLDIAQYLLFSRRRTTKITDTVQERFNQALAFLKDIAAAKASLDQPATAATPQSSLAGPEYSHKDRELTFREENIKGFV